MLGRNLHSVKRFYCRHHQGSINSVARVHATYTDDEMLGVTKYSFQNFISSIQHMQLQSFHATFLAEILSAAFIFNEDLACELEIIDFSEM